MIAGEHDSWLFLRKPAGVPVFPRNDGSPGPCLLAALIAERPEQAEPPWPEGFAGGIVHRLDTSTSGLVVAARTPDALGVARALFAKGALRKQYLFLTDRTVPWRSSRVETAIAHHPRDRRKMVWQRSPNTPHRGRWYPARTQLTYGGRRGSYHLWSAAITTGVTHQIRVHAAAVGLGLLGDRLYGGTRHCRPSFNLHAQRIDGWPVPTPDLAPPAEWPA